MELTKLESIRFEKIGLDEDLHSRRYLQKSHPMARQTLKPIHRQARARYRPRAHRSLAKLRGRNTAHNAFLQRIEQACIAPLGGTTTQSPTMADFPHADAGKLRTFNPQHEKENKTTAETSAPLFQEIKSVMEGGQS